MSQVEAYEEQVKSFEEHIEAYDEQVQSYAEQVQRLNEDKEDLSEKLSAANEEITIKETAVKQHSKVAEDAVAGTLQERSNMLVKVSEETSRADAEIETLKSNLEMCERVVSKELEIRIEEKNMCIRSAEVANKQHLEGVKKIAKLEAECQRLRSLVRKKMPGPAALAQMKLEVENSIRQIE